MGRDYITIQGQTHQKDTPILQVQTAESRKRCETGLKGEIGKPATVCGDFTVQGVSTRDRTTRWNSNKDVEEPDTTVH